MVYSNKIKEAIHFASIAHKEQKRKVFNYPCISHPLTVLFIVSNFTKDEDTLISAILHDVAEDTERNLDDIEKLFGKKVRDIVDILSEDMSVPKNEGQLKQLERFKTANHKVLIIALADTIHNTCDIFTILENHKIENFSNLSYGTMKYKIEYAKQKLNIIENAWKENPLLPEAKLRIKEYKNLLYKLNLLD